ncbi:Serine-threonine/tyrosine-protein kinase, catalytic domain [Dillenia turbinata]|uniref:non-specific serine/threonine protein kinase n=1 Tax=Dillenia turbinata TaxID=194707 RepID=A0AAN8W9X3_9MAGN
MVILSSWLAQNGHLPLLLFSILFVLLNSSVTAISFNITMFTPSYWNIIFSGSAYVTNLGIQLTPNINDEAVMCRTTESEGNENYGDRMTFFLAPYGLDIQNKYVSVEFDTFHNPWDPEGNHIGINVNFLISVSNLSWYSDHTQGTRNEAHISHNSTSKNLSVVVNGTHDEYTYEESLFYIIDLRHHLPETHFWLLSLYSTGNQKKKIAEEEKLGKGGFRGLYRGLLPNTSIYIAVKKVARGSRQGKKEYIGEVKIIKTWVPISSTEKACCHGLYAIRLLKTWPPPCSTCMKHAINVFCIRIRRPVLLCGKLSLKLSLERLVDHGKPSATTVLAGTIGYMAPECIAVGKASKESDIYSYGIVCLQIACGRRAINSMAGKGIIRLAEWVWEFHGLQKLRDAVDPRPEEEFDEDQLNG